jgi:hypothetical protein
MKIKLLLLGRRLSCRTAPASYKTHSSQSKDEDENKYNRNKAVSVRRLRIFIEIKGTYLKKVKRKINIVPSPLHWLDLPPVPHLHHNK